MNASVVMIPIGRVDLPEVVLRFPDLLVATQVKGKGEFKYRSNLVFATNSKAANVANAAVLAVATEEWKNNAANVLRSLSKDKNSLRKGDDQLAKDGSIRNGYEGMLYVSATRRVIDGAPLVCAADRIDPSTGKLKRYFSDKDVDDQTPYDGSIVNANVDFYAYEKEGQGKGIFCTLRGVQYVRNGKNFSGSRPADLDDFKILATEENDPFA